MAKQPMPEVIASNPMSAATVVDKLNAVKPGQQLIIDHSQHTGIWHATVWDLPTHMPIEGGIGSSPAEAVAAIRDPRAMKRATPANRRRWITEEQVDLSDGDERNDV